MDVILFTLPLSTIQQMTQWVLAIYHNVPSTPTPVRFNPPDTIIIPNMFDHLASKGIFDQIKSVDDPFAVQTFSNQVKDIVAAIKHPASEIRTKWDPTSDSRPHLDSVTGHETCSSLRTQSAL